MSDIQQSFNSSIIGPLSLDGLIELSEYSIDEIIKNDTIKQIPVIKTLFAVIQTGLNIRDRLFLKKITVFLAGISHIPEDKRQEMINKIDNSKKYRIRVGEKLLYILDNCDDCINAENVAKLFSAMISGEISYEEYLGASRIVSRVSADELKLFIDSHYEPPALSYEAISLLHTGLVFVDAEKIDVKVVKREPADWDDSYEYYDSQTSGGETIPYSTQAGDVIFKVLGCKEK